MATTIRCGAGTKVTLEMGDGVRYVMNCRVADVRPTKTALPGAVFGEEPVDFAGEPEVEVLLVAVPERVVPRETVARQMARAVLEGGDDATAAARALADLLIDDVKLAGGGLPTYDDLHARIDDLERQLRDARESPDTWEPWPDPYPESD